jgi:hypothetical protein
MCSSHTAFYCWSLRPEYFRVKEKPLCCESLKVFSTYGVIERPGKHLEAEGLHVTKSMVLPDRHDKARGGNEANSMCKSDYNN